jgi:hypothetical protein
MRCADPTCWVDGIDPRCPSASMRGMLMGIADIVFEHDLSKHYTQAFTYWQYLVSNRLGNMNFCV